MNPAIAALTKIDWAWVRRTVAWFDALSKPITQADKLAWLRRYVDPGLPDIYHMEAEGFVPNGCGPAANAWLSALIPDHLPLLPWFEVGGDYHDYLYWKGGTEEDHKRADAALRRVMLLLAGQSVRWWNPVSWTAPARMRPVADAYWLAVRQCGASCFTLGEAPLANRLWEKV